MIDPDEIMQYLYGELSPEKKREFENRMEKDKELSDEVNAVRASLEFIEDEFGILQQYDPEFNQNIPEFGTLTDYEKEIRTKNDSDEIEKDVQEYLKNRDEIDPLISGKLNQARKEYERKRKRIPIMKKLIIWAAAAILVLSVTIESFRYIQRKNSAPEKLYSEFYQRYDVLAYRGTGKEADTLFNLALDMYNSKDYIQAIETLEEINLRESSDEDAQFYKAMSFMELKQYDKAILVLEKLLTANLEDSRDKCLWYLGLCRLARKETRQAAENFMLLKNSHGLYKNYAEDILSRMDLKSLD